MGYKLGFVRGPTYHKYCPRRCSSGKSYIRSIRYKKNRHRKKHRTKKKRATRSQFVKLFLSAIPTFLNVDKRVRTRDLLPYDIDSTTMVCDISANVHICNKRNMFVGEIRKCKNQGVANIGGKGHQLSGIGTVCWIWRDNYGKSHEYLVKDALFFPQSPINILSVTCFARQLNDLTGTGIDTKQLTSCFYWDSSKYSLTIHHPPANLPEISINEGFALSTFFLVLVSRVFNTYNRSKYGCCYTKMDDDYYDDPHATKHEEHSTRCGC